MINNQFDISSYSKVMSMNIFIGPIPITIVNHCEAEYEMGRNFSILISESMTNRFNIYTSTRKYIPIF